MKNNHQNNLRRGSGFTLVELLVVITIIIVLAVLSISVVGRMRLAAAKSRSISQLRNISVGLVSWMADNSAPEPFYVASGTGDYPHESGNGKGLKPGNPASALYNRTDPSAGYIQDFTVFYSSLTRVPSGLPTEANYNPSKASQSAVWGTFTYFYPHVTAARRTARQESNGVVTIASSRSSIDGKLVMSEFYEGSWVTAKFGKEVHHVLLSDWSVQYVADSNTRFNQWKSAD